MFGKNTQTVASEKYWAGDGFGHPDLKIVIVSCSAPVHIICNNQPTNSSAIVGWMWVMS